MKYLIFLLLFVSGCAIQWRHSWAIVDKNTNECWYLYSSNLDIGSKVSWYNSYGDLVYTSDSYNLRRADDEDYAKHFRDMGIEDPELVCRNGLNKR